jgi:hypothetical protein
MTPLFLHVGANKTGTSAIQRFCNSQRASLAANGVLYPAAGCSGEAHYRLSDAFGFGHGAASEEARRALQADIRSALAAEIAATDARQVVFSSENFVLYGSVVAVRDFFRDFDVRVVVYVRRHDSWWPSAWNQSVRHAVAPKWGRGLDAYVAFQRAMNPRYGDWRKLVERWASVFGKAAVIVRPYERAQIAPGIVTDFFRQLGRPELAAEAAAPVNESLDAWSLQMLDIAQHADIAEDARQRIIEYTLRHPRTGAPFLPSAEQARRFVEPFRADYEYLAREYLGRADGQLFREPLPQDDSGSTASPAPAAEEVMAWTLKALDASERSR